MRTIANELDALLHSGSYEPAVKIEVGDFQFTRDFMSSCSNIKEVNPVYTSVKGGRILRVDHTEQVYTASLELLLSNADKILNGVDLTGKKLRVWWGGYTVQGDETSAMYANCAPLRVRTQDHHSQEGYLLTSLKCFGMMDELNHDKATEKFIATDEQTVRYLVEHILHADIPAFASYEYFAIQWDSEDALISQLVPGNTFVIDVNESRLQSISRLLNMTRCVLRPGNEPETESGYRTFHILVPVKAGYDYAFHYQLEDIPFWIKHDITELVMPNHIVVRTPSNMTSQLSGEARDAQSIADYKVITQTEYLSKLESNAQAQLVAEAILSNVQARREVGSALTPLDFSTELFDWGKLTDAREGTEAVGNAGVIRRLFDAGTKEYKQTMTLGGWLDVKKVEMPIHLQSDPPWKTTRHIPTWYIDGKIEWGRDQVLGVRFPYVTTWTLIMASLLEYADDDVIINFKADGYYVHVLSLRCTIPAGQKFAMVEPIFTDLGSGKDETGDYRFAPFTLITMDIDNTGDPYGKPGENLTVQMFIEAKWDEE